MHRSLATSSTRAALTVAAVLAGLLAAGCGNGDRASQETGQESQAHGQTGPYLNAVDTATIAQAYKQVRLVCNQGRGAAGELERRLEAAAEVARRQPDKIYRAGTSNEGRPTVDVIANLAAQLRDCGEAKLATTALSRGRPN
ncbi:MAG TPA: hypothetical protein VM299_05730 [Solirubrobacteraceae bacterium]|jgi:hypothetical protein|nr:hypothetical protein [Solirubrobacteraceae bacterium]